MRLLLTNQCTPPSPPRPSQTPPRYYALLAERFCKLRREYADCFSEAFVRQYQLIHRCGTCARCFFVGTKTGSLSFVCGNVRQYQLVHRWGRDGGPSSRGRWVLAGLVPPTGCAGSRVAGWVPRRAPAAACTQLAPRYIPAPLRRLETNKLRNTAKLFAHLLSTDAIPWAVLQVGGRAWWGGGQGRGLQRSAGLAAGSATRAVHASTLAAGAVALDTRCGAAARPLRPCHLSSPAATGLAAGADAARCCLPDRPTPIALPPAGDPPGGAGHHLRTVPHFPPSILPCRFPSPLVLRR